MPRFNPALTAYLRTHHGVVAAGVLPQLGVTPEQLRALLAAGELIAVFDGVYRHALWPDTFESECAALCAEHPDVVISCGGATRLADFRGCNRLPLHITTSRLGKPSRTGICAHRCPVMPAEHVHDRGDGIRVTTPARTMFDIARHVSWTTLESAIEQGVRREQFTIADLLEIGRLLCRRGRPGSALFAAVLRSRPAWRRPIDSHPELVLLKALRRVGLELETQVPLTLPDGSTIHPDLGHCECGFFIEIDDHEWHGGRLESSYDDRRDRQVRLAGARVERVSTTELRPVRPRLIAELVNAHQQQHDLHVSRHLSGVQPH